jgi:hypothetical protein
MRKRDDRIRRHRITHLRLPPAKAVTEVLGVRDIAVTDHAVQVEAWAFELGHDPMLRLVIARLRGHSRALAQPS